MGIDVDVSFNDIPIDAISFGPTSVDVVPVPGGGILHGWSIREASGNMPSTFEGSVTTPGAAATIVTSTGLGAGTYTVSWTVELSGTPSATDANNFQLLHNATQVAISVNLGAVGAYPQIQQNITVAQGDTISIASIAAATAGAIYSAELAISPNALLGTLIEIQDGGNPLGESGADYQESDTRWFGRPGVRFRGQVKIHVIYGNVTGVVYISNPS